MRALEEMVFMAVRNLKASLLPPAAPTGGCFSPLCFIVSYCQMMAMAGASVGSRLEGATEEKVAPGEGWKRL